LYLSLIACCALVIAVTAESSALAGASWPATFGQLLVCRFRDPGVRSGCCLACGYNLYGLREMRCPECGRAFTFAEVGRTAEEMGYAEAGVTASRVVVASADGQDHARQ
jgi:hypothetical protein